MNFNEFTNLYSLQKTLRFELIPVGRTAQKIQELQEGEDSTLLQRDTERARQYQKAKKMIDAYHRLHIEEALPLVDFEKQKKKKDLEFIQSNLFRKEFADTDEKEKTLKKIETSQENLRKGIVKILTGSVEKKFLEKYAKKDIAKIEIIKERYAFFGKKELFDPGKNSDFRNAAVRDGFTNGEFEETIGSFKGFTTYFKGFHENRGNMYSDGAEGTAISNRCINENLPKFLSNIQVLEKVKSALAKEFKEVEKNLCAGKKLASFFDLDSFQNHLSQSGIEEYNLILGGKFEKDSKEKVHGLNEKINLYNQKHPDARLPYLKPLYKQILAKTETASFRPEPFESDSEMLKAIEEFWEKQIQNPKHFMDQKIFPVLENFQEISKKLGNMKNKELAGVFVDAKRLSALSHQAFGDWGLLRTALHIKFESDQTFTSESAKERAVNSYMNHDSYTLLELEEALNYYFENVKNHEETRNNRKSLKAFFSELKFTETLSREDKGELQTEEIERDLLEMIKERYKDILPVLQAKNPEDNLHQKKGKGGEVERMKQFLDSLKTLQRHLAYLHSENSETNDFYYHWDGCYEALSPLTQLYNKVRNRLTRKPFSEEKMKLNFEHQNLLSGWTESVTEKSNNGTQYGGYLFRKKNQIGEYDYFLGVSKSAKLFPYAQSESIAINDISDYERLNYYQLASKSFYNSYFKDSITGLDYSALKEKAKKFLMDYANSSESQVGELIEKHFAKDDAVATGCFKKIQKTLPEDFSKMLKNKEFKEINSSIKNGITTGVHKLNRLPGASDFNTDMEYYWEVDAKLSKLLNDAKVYEYFSISDSEFQRRIADNSHNGLYLFRIANKDLNYAESKEKRNRTKRGKENLHTIYFKHLMSANQSVYDLGTGEVFFRKASIINEDRVIHQKNSPIQRRTSDKKSQFKYDIIKDKRYTEDKYSLHLSTSWNFSAIGDGKSNSFNPLVLDYLNKSKKIKAIGIDRGERHLLYLTLIDEKGKILKQFSLNTVKNEAAQSDIDYRDKLDKKEKERQAARENWDVIENIKELKEGYLSQVVHRISEILVENQAILIMEDLNFGFKRGRFKVEKQVYQKFEKMLIDKLNYLVFKGKKPTEPGGSLNAYQLTSKFTAFKDLGKQTGMIFYVPASYTSKVDPITGFYDFLKPKATTIPSNQSFFQKFDSIRYNKTSDRFEFEATYGKFIATAGGESNRKKSKTDATLLADLAAKKWTICSHDAERYRIKRTKNGSVSYVAVDCNQEFKGNLKKAGISYEDGSELRDRIAASNDAAFLKGMIETLRTLLALRYNNGKKGADEKDYILSPVADAKGRFFNSLESDETLPKDADANGAYHIAKKGLLLVDKIRKFEPVGNKKYPDLSLSNHEWFYSLWFQ